MVVTWVYMFGTPVNRAHATRSGIICILLYGKVRIAALEVCHKPERFTTWRGHVYCVCNNIYNLVNFITIQPVDNAQSSF